MHKHPLRHVALFVSLLLLSACRAPSTPQEVSQAFWAAVCANNAQAAVEYSTLNDTQGYDGYSRDWSGYQVSWGKVVIDSDQASIDTELSRLSDAGTTSRKFVTYLVRQNETWKVDYVRTGESLRGDPFANLFEHLDAIGKTLSQQLAASSEDFSAEAERMGKELQRFAEAFGQQANAAVERYGAQLRRKIDELAKSVERALKEYERKLSPADKRRLREVAAELNSESESLAQPSVQSITDSSITLGKAQMQLEMIDDDAVGRYKEEWQKWRKGFEADMQQLLDEANTSATRQSI